MVKFENIERKFNKCEKISGKTVKVWKMSKKNF